MSWGENFDFDSCLRLFGAGDNSHSFENSGIGLYAIVDSAERVRQVVQAGVKTVQLRIKAPDAAALRASIAQALDACRAAGATLVVNDHWRLAAELGAPAAHLGQEDLLALGDAGRGALAASGLRLGISSHSLWELCRARTLAPWYVACGPVWPTLTKAMPWRPQGLDNLAWWVRMAGAPVVAIGGILDHAQAEQAAQSGAAGVCVVRGLGAMRRRPCRTGRRPCGAGGRCRPFRCLRCRTHRSHSNSVISNIHADNNPIHPAIRARADHRRQRLGRRRGHSGRPENLCRPGLLRHERHHRADGAKHPRRDGHPRRAGGLSGRADRRRAGRYRCARGQDRHAARTRDREHGGRRHRPPRAAPVVLDPVMVSATGAPLIEPPAVQALVRELFPRASLITPNLDEAALLLGRPIASTADLEPAAQALLAQGARAVLLKGGHLPGDEVLDVLAITGQPPQRLLDARIATPQPARRGLHLSSAIAAHLALGLDLSAAVRAARTYVRQALQAGAAVRTGHGVGPLDHGFAPVAVRRRPLRGSD
jgi:thiamine-phosphate diphosphorylase